ncbi:MAG TPA: hypothetical protein VH601_12770 [Bryobacteraceae bacterium]|jgi:hypothetical protein
MSPRSIRRAAERKARKRARRGETRLAQIPVPESVPASLTQQPSPAPISEANAVDEAAFLSEPKIQARTGLTGRTVLLPSEDAARYEQQLREFFDELQPVDPRECALVQSLADTAWRLARIPGLEMAIYAHGRIEFADLFADHDAALRPSLIEMHTFLQYEKQLRNLQLQQGRLRRQREKDTAELRQLQQDRRATEQPATEIAVARKAPDSKLGFEFSTIANESDAVRNGAGPQIETDTFFTSAGSAEVAQTLSLPHPDSSGMHRAGAVVLELSA